MFFEQIEKFQCLLLSTGQGASCGILRIHVGTCHVSQNVSKSQPTLEYNIFKNQTCLISRTIPPTHQMPYGAGTTVRTPVQIILLYISFLWPPVNSNIGFGGTRLGLINVKLLEGSCFQMVNCEGLAT